MGHFDSLWTVLSNKGITIPAVIPINTLAHRSDWVLEQTNKAYIITTPSEAITLHSGNPFVRTDHGFMQLRLAPQEWDGALWFPLSNLSDLF